MFWVVLCLIKTMTQTRALCDLHRSDRPSTSRKRKRTGANNLESIIEKYNDVMRRYYNMRSKSLKKVVVDTPNVSRTHFYDTRRIAELYYVDSDKLDFVRSRLILEDPNVGLNTINKACHDVLLTDDYKQRIKTLSEQKILVF